MLFREIYACAGQIRDVHIVKSNTRFANYGHVATEAEHLIAELAREDWLVGPAQTPFAQPMAITGVS